MDTRKGGSKSVVSCLFPVILIMAFLVAISHGYALAWTCGGTETQCAQYLAAITDAKDNFNASRISNSLTPIVEENENLIWLGGVVGSKVLVAAYKWGTAEAPPFSTCQPGTAFPKDCPVSRSVWVTMVPELYDFFKKHTYSSLRIEQLLGLPPNYGNNYIVEYWVNPSDLFRPAPDPQIVYQEGSMKFPWDSSHQLALNTTGDYNVYDDFCTQATAPCPCTGSRFTDYKCWFQNRRAFIYSYDFTDAPYPWTGLGYTYDWGNSKTTVGLSEFVFNKAPIYGDSITTTIQSVSVASDYFSRSSKYTLTVYKSGLGKGSVTSKPGGLSCGSKCTTTSKSFSRYSQVTLTAKAAKDSAFTGWSGACSGTASTCTMTMVGDVTATAAFASTE
jgi:hypothetical protein